MEKIEICRNDEMKFYLLICKEEEIEEVREGRAIILDEKSAVILRDYMIEFIKNWKKFKRIVLPEKRSPNKNNKQKKV